MITEAEAVELRYWQDFLTAQRAHFTRSYTQQTGSPYVPDDVQAAFLLIDDELVRDEIEQAVTAFIHSESWPAQWPSLKPRACLHLDFRAFMSLGMIALIVQGTPEGRTIKNIAVPDLGNYRAAVRWLFLHFWKMGGEKFLTEMADAFIRKTTALDSGK